MFLYLVLSNHLPLVLHSLWWHKFLAHAHKVLWHNQPQFFLSERRSIFNASQWSKLSNVSDYFTAYKSVHSPELIWVTQSSLDFILALFRGCQGLQDSSKKCRHFSHHFFQNTSGLGVLASSIDTNLNYEITMFFIHTGTNTLQQSYY